MTAHSALTRIEILEDHSPGGDRFLFLHRYLVRNHYTDGTSSRPYKIDFIDRIGLDSVAVTLYYRENNQWMICIHQGIRAAVWFRQRQPRPLSDEKPYLSPWEAVAGSVEPGETGMDALKARACAEALEEAGCAIRPDDCVYLGSLLPSHGQSSERVFLFAAEIDPAARRPPAGDGSVNESAAPPPVWLVAEQILDMCRTGEIEDPKIELGVRRLMERISR